MVSSSRAFYPKAGTTAGTFAAGDDSRLTGAGSKLTVTAVKTSNYTAAANEFVQVNAASGAVVVTLPAANTAGAGALVVVKRTEFGGNSVTVQRAGSDTIGTGAATSVAIVTTEGLTLVSTGAGTWMIVSQSQSLTGLDARYVGVNGAHAAIGAATTTDVITAQVTGDSQQRLIINANGVLEWGSGSGAVDVNLYRGNANELWTDDRFTTVGVGASSVCQVTYIAGAGGVSHDVRGDGKHEWGNTSGSLDTNLYRQTTDILATDDDFALRTAGKGLQVKEGSNARMGTATLVAGTVTVSNTSVTANTRIMLTIQSLGTVTAPKAIGITARTASTSFAITSADNTDTSVVAWFLMEPAS